MVPYFLYACSCGSLDTVKYLIDSGKEPNVRYIVTLQKQVGCFNHRVVALVADKLERQWLLEVCFGVED